LSRALLQLPALEATQTRALAESHYSRQPRTGSCWYHDGEVIQVIWGDQNGLTLFRAVGHNSVCKAHPAAYWEEVEVYEP